MPGRYRSILREKWKESLASVLPVTGIVLVICFFIAPVPSGALLAFSIGAALLVLGMGLFTLGTDTAMTPIGEHVGAAITGRKKLWLVLLTGFLAGVLITVSEPDLQVLAEQVPGVPNLLLICAVAVGVGLFLMAALLRVLFKISIRSILLISYVLIFALAQFVPKSFLAVAFDAGGVTTGPMTVPFILALGVGVSSIRGDGGAESDSFGLVALCSVGPILAVMLLALIFQPDAGVYAASAIPDAQDSRELGRLFLSDLPKYAGDVAIALAPIIAFFLVFQFTVLHLHGKELVKILIGLAYTYVGLTLFLLGVNVGFMPVGSYIGQILGEGNLKWLLLPLGMLIGWFIVAAEPAVHVLNKQVYEITAGAIAPHALSRSLSVGVSVSVGLAMIRVLTGLNIMWLLIPGYVIALGLMFLSPPLFTSIAFDAGGVASGPMTATFLLPLAMGACSAVGGDVAADAFGVVAMVAMTPLITIQLLGLKYKRMKRAQDARLDAAESIIEL